MSAPAQASAAAAPREPAASPTAVTRTVGGVGGRVGGHRAGLARAELVTASRSASGCSGEGGSRRTVTLPPSR